MPKRICLRFLSPMRGDSYVFCAVTSHHESLITKENRTTDGNSPSGRAFGHLTHLTLPPQTEKYFYFSDPFDAELSYILSHFTVSYFIYVGDRLYI